MRGWLNGWLAGLVSGRLGGGPTFSHGWGGKRGRRAGHGLKTVEGEVALGLRENVEHVVFNNRLLFKTRCQVLVVCDATNFPSGIKGQLYGSTQKEALLQHRTPLGDAAR